MVRLPPWPRVWPSVLAAALAALVGLSSLGAVCANHDGEVLTAAEHAAPATDIPDDELVDVTEHGK